MSIVLASPSLHFLLLSRFSLVRLCDPIDGSPWGAPVPGILQARTLEWVASSFSNAWKWKVKVKSLSRAQLLATPWTTAHQAPPSMGFFHPYLISNSWNITGSRTFLGNISGSTHCFVLTLWHYNNFIFRCEQPKFYCLIHSKASSLFPARDVSSRT